ncbi:glutamate 5-kinase, partial [Stenotrophomonas maltophilia]
DALFIATDIDGVYSADPRTVAVARPLHDVPELCDEVLAMAGGAGSRAGPGGNRTKLEAGATAGRLGLATDLVNG